MSDSAATPSSAASIEPKPGVAVCQSCDPPRHVPAGEVVAHLTEHHLSLSEIDHAEVQCAHEWEYDEEESKGPWTGYIERCKVCGALQQVPQ